jgi:aminoglycoside phosphotransferase (APT) family kinase protein
MNAWPVMSESEETQAALGAALRAGQGTGARLERWTAHPLSKRGKRRAVRYDLETRMTGVAAAGHQECVGKFYERDADARRTAAVLRQLAGADFRRGGDLVIQGVLGYHAPLRLLLLTYEPGESVIAATAREPARVLPAIGRGLAALHALPVCLEETTSVTAVLEGLRRRIDDLATRFPGEGDLLREILRALERVAPRDPVPAAFLHGDLGPAQILWQAGRIVMLDFDKCTLGDAAMDLANLFVQLRRLTRRKPGKLPALDDLRRGILVGYGRHSGRDAGLIERIGWYEAVMLVRKIQFLAADRTRHPEAGKVEQRQAEVIGLLSELPTLVRSACDR